MTTRRVAALVVLAAAGGFTAGCSSYTEPVVRYTHHVVNSLLPDTASLADRCAAVMRLAMPAADIKVENRTSESIGISGLIARVEGVRQELPADTQVSRDIAAECQFDNAILIGFHWTKGGPSPPPAPETPRSLPAPEGPK